MLWANVTLSPTPINFEAVDITETLRLKMVLALKGEPVTPAELESLQVYFDDVYEPKDSTILKEENLGVSVQEFNEGTVIDADYVHTDNNYTDDEKDKLAELRNYVKPASEPISYIEGLTATLSNKTSTLATCADLANIDNNTAETIIVKESGRGGVFMWSATGTANNGTIFAGLTGFWHRQYNGAIDVKWFGAKGDGVTDDTIAINTANNAVGNDDTLLFSGIFAMNGVTITHSFHLTESSSFKYISDDILTVSICLTIDSEVVCNYIKIDALHTDGVTLLPTMGVYILGGATLTANYIQVENVGSPLNVVGSSYPIYVAGSLVCDTVNVINCLNTGASNESTPQSLLVAGDAKIGTYYVNGSATSLYLVGGTVFIDTFYCWDRTDNLIYGVGDININTIWDYGTQSNEGSVFGGTIHIGTYNMSGAYINLMGTVEELFIDKINMIKNKRLDVNCRNALLVSKTGNYNKKIIINGVYGLTETDILINLSNSTYIEYVKITNVNLEIHYRNLGNTLSNFIYLGTSSKIDEYILKDIYIDYVNGRIDTAAESYLYGVWGAKIRGTIDNIQLNSFNSTKKTLSLPFLRGSAAGTTDYITNVPYVTTPGLMITSKNRFGFLNCIPAIPTTGTWRVREKLINTSPVAGGVEGWICTISGTNGTLSGYTASTTAGSATITLSAPINIGTFITIAGVYGSKEILEVVENTATLNSACNTTVTNAVVSYYAPTWKSFGSISA